MPTENKTAEPLQVERSTVTKLVITGAKNLDRITVFLEDLAPCKGKITVSCWGSRGTAGTATRATSAANYMMCALTIKLAC